jgi:hypothetical protein
MTKRTQLRLAIATLLIAAALVTRSETLGWATVGALVFGLFNLLFAPPGAEWLTALAIAGTVAALFGSGGVFAIAFLLVWIAWVPAFIVAWTRAVDEHMPPGKETLTTEAAARARVAVAALIVAVAVSSVAYRFFVAHNLGQTAALFVGIPSLLAIIVVFGVSPQSATGVAFKAVTVGLLISMLFLGEGILCVVMSAPLFYAVAAAVGAAADMARARQSSTMCSCLVLLVLVPLSLEGVTDVTTLNRDETVSATALVRGTPAQVQRALFDPPRFDRVLPLYLRAGFPVPVSTTVDRSGDKARWIIQVRGGEMRLNGMEPRTGELVLELEEQRPGRVRWRATSDTSHMTHFLTWRDIDVTWEAVDDTHTTVTWTLRYERGLDPSWYFGPWERYATQLAARYLIDAVATP